MRKIVNSTYVTLDGVITDPQDWPALGTFSEAGYQVQYELLERCDAVLMGRHTYDGFAPVWSGRSGDPYSDRINAVTKYVVSTIRQHRDIRRLAPPARIIGSLQPHWLDHARERHRHPHVSGHRS